MTKALQELIFEARTQLGSEACAAGRHVWQPEDGGRACPKDIRGDCSQTVYRCHVCGSHDYGEPGGPGAHDCATQCPGEDYRYTGKLL